ncbi:MAG: CDP-alcohol phosphatidyltransferase family protein, partial [Sedimentisphaerales bacterium]|nr:CDP-alcohol phosphatidyltransferase family protein [Sedimentisphaerales bacterium]
RYVSLVIFVVAVASDALDGYLARKYRQETLLGRFLDPLADKLLITCSVLLLAIPSTGLKEVMLPDMLVVLIIGKDLYTVLGFIIIYFITSELHIVPARMGKSCTVVQAVMVPAMLLAPDVLPVWTGYRTVVEILWWSVGAAAVLTVITYTRNGSRYVNAFEQRQQGQAQSKVRKTVLSRKERREQSNRP